MLEKKIACNLCTMEFATMPEWVEHVERQHPPPMREPLLQEREKTHGSFEQNAKLWKGFISVSPLPGNSAQSLALSMIYMKLSRILSGQANFKDHWDDIAGYAKLAAEACHPGDGKC